MDLSPLEQRLLAVKKVEKAEECRFVSAKTKTSYYEEGRGRWICLGQRFGL
jgi:hypothetical protein